MHFPQATVKSLFLCQDFCMEICAAFKRSSHLGRLRDGVCPNWRVRYKFTYWIVWYIHSACIWIVDDNWLTKHPRCTARLFQRQKDLFINSVDRVSYCPYLKPERRPVHCSSVVGPTSCFCQSAPDRVRELETHRRGQMGCLDKKLGNAGFGGLGLCVT